MNAFDTDLALQYLPMLIFGLGVTIYYAIASLAVGLIIGLVIALARLSRRKVLRLVSRVYVDAFRGTPLLVQLFILYYGLPSLGIRLSAEVAAIAGLGMNSGAYMAEIFRGGIEAVPRAHVQAARSLGMGRTQTLRRIVLPQAMVLVLPPLANEVISQVKSTSLISTIAIGELLRAGQLAVSITFAPVEIYFAVALLYLAVNLSLSQLVQYFENRSSGRSRIEMTRTMHEVGV